VRQLCNPRSTAVWSRLGNFAAGGFDDPSMKTIINDTFLAGTLRNVGGNWLFWNMTAGPSSPLSYDHSY
jgi:hypothetical protein